LAHLLAEYPELPDATLADDTPTANSETRAWIREAFGRESLPALGEPLAGAQSLSADGQGDTP
ncbi:MAG: type VI secretion system domain-containing protein, partial [Acidobacteria bacterium]|nr:type VI secretion system domain-containing protein [Acidobacteriota bacterium]